MKNTRIRWSKLIFLALLLSFSIDNIRAQTIYISHCLGKCPEYNSVLAASRANIMVHNLYAAAVNGDTGLPDWVVYRLVEEAVGVASLLPRYWQPDRLDKYSIADELFDLNSSEYAQLDISSAGGSYYSNSEAETKVDERARLAPMTSFANTPYWADLNNLSNMTPMPTPLRVGAWLRLEQALNALVKQDGELFVITGPLYLDAQSSIANTAAIGFNPVAYFKIIASNSAVAAFVFPQQLAQHERYCTQQVNLVDIERMAGIQFFPDRILNKSSALLADLACAAD